MEQIIKVAWDLNENTENRYQLVYEIAELAKNWLMKIRLKKLMTNLYLKKIMIPATQEKIRLSTLLWLKRQKQMTIVW